MPETSEQKTYAVFALPKNKKLIAELENSGAAVIRLPPARLSAAENPDLARAPENINQFDWIIFTDVYAAEFFLEMMRERDFDLFELDDLHVCALGEAVAERLRLAQIHTDVVPTVNTPEKIVDAIADYIFGDGDFAGKRFLLLKESNERAEFFSALENKNAEVSETAIYLAETAQSHETAKVKALIKGGAVDEILFAAPEGFLQICFLFRPENITEALRGVKIAAADETTQQTLRENQIPAVLLFRRSTK